MWQSHEIAMFVLAAFFASCAAAFLTMAVLQFGKILACGG
jgi:hypothetical protein